jgi:hypothetical protein
MKRILIINHYWPPTGGACVQRWVDFSYQLKELGYDITIITPENPGFELIDHTLEKRVHKNIKVVKIAYKNIVSGARKTIGNNKLSLFIRGNFFLPDARMRWNKSAIKYIESRIHNFDLLITTGPPHSTHFIGFQFRNRIKWIADFHDFWTDAIYIKVFNRTWFAHIIDKSLEKKILKSADAILVHCESAMEKYTKITNKKIHLIPMGFHSELFETEKPEIEYKTISHIGTFFSNYKNALELLNNLCNNGYKFIQVGKVDDGIIFPEGSEIIPYLEHAAAIEIMRKSEKLLLVNDNDFLPGKIFEYLASTRTIILITKAGSDAERIVDQNQDCDYQAIQEKFSRISISEKIDKIIKDLVD